MGERIEGVLVVPVGMCGKVYNPLCLVGALAHLLCAWVVVQEVIQGLIACADSETHFRVKHTFDT